MIQQFGISVSNLVFVFSSFNIYLFLYLCLRDFFSSLFNKLVIDIYAPALRRVLVCNTRKYILVLLCLSIIYIK